MILQHDFMNDKSSDAGEIHVIISWNANFLKCRLHIADPFEQVLSKLLQGLSHQMDSTFVDM